MVSINGTARLATNDAGIIDSVLGDIMTGGRAAPRPNPEVLARAKRRAYTAAYKLKVLGEADAARGSGEIGAVLRKHGLYSSHLAGEGERFNLKRARGTLARASHGSKQWPRHSD